MKQKYAPILRYVGMEFEGDFNAKELPENGAGTVVYADGGKKNGRWVKGVFEEKKFR